MLFSFIIVSWNTREKTCACIDSILKYMPGHEVIVVDNNSADDSCEQIRIQFSEIKLVENNDNRGFGAANNQGASIATGDVLCFINSDAALIDDSLTMLAESVVTDAQLGAVGPQILRGDGSFEFSYGQFPEYWSLLVRFGFEFFLPIKSLFDPYEKYWLRKFRESRSVDWITGCCFVIRKELFEELGGWDERYFAYFEDVDLCRRIIQKDHKIAYNPSATVIHHHSSSFEQTNWVFRIQQNLQSACLYLFGDENDQSSVRFRRRIVQCWKILEILSYPFAFSNRVNKKREIIRKLWKQNV